VAPHGTLAELSLRGVRDVATSTEIASAAPRNDNQGDAVTGPAPYLFRFRYL